MRYQPIKHAECHQSAARQGAKCSARLTPIAAALMGLTCLLPLPALAAPTGGNVTSGAAGITQSGATTTINQSSAKATINWQGFSIANHETVNFVQPSASAMTLNRVIGSEKSLIDGALNANGKVFLINASGIVFGQGASINVGGLVASTLNITDENFNAGNFVFQGNSNGAQVINRAVIRVPDESYIALLGQQAINEGVIIAKLGTVTLNGANKVTLNFSGDSLVSVALDEGAINALVENKQMIFADGGRVFLSAKAADSLVASKVNLSGVIEAGNIADLLGTGGTTVEANEINLTGALDWTGSLTLTADKSTHINAPLSSTDTNAALTINGDYNILTKASFAGVDVVAPTPGVAGAGASTAKQDTSGGVYGSITFGETGGALTIDGQSYELIHNIAELEGNKTGNFALARDIDLTGKNYSATGSVIGTLDGTFAGLGHTLNGLTIGTEATPYAGTSNYVGLIGASQTTTATNVIRDLGVTNVSIYSNKEATLRIGSVVGNFLGEISGVYSTGKIQHNYLAATIGGLVGYVPGTAAKNTNLVNNSFSSIDITTVTGAQLGGLIGRMNYGEIANSHATGKIESTGEIYNGSYAGGLIGYLSGSTVRNAYYAGDGISGIETAGGLIGNIGSVVVTSNNTTTVLNSFAKGKGDSRGVVSGSVGGIGGLIGKTPQINSNNFVLVENSYANMDVVSVVKNHVTTGVGVGGLIGWLDEKGIIVRYSHALGDVTVSGASGSILYVGGLIGSAGVNTNLSYVYAKGKVANNAEGANLTSTGGLVGTMRGASNDGYHSGKIIGSYSTGDVVSKEGSVGGLIGYGVIDSIENSYASGSLSGTVSDSSFVGGLVGYGDITGSISNSYYDQEKNSNINVIGDDRSGTPVSNDGRGLTTEQLGDSDITDAITSGGDPYQVIADKKADDDRKAAEDAARKEAEEKAEADRIAADEAVREAERLAKIRQDGINSVASVSESQTKSARIQDQNIASAIQINLNEAILDFSLTKPARSSADAKIGDYTAGIRTVLVNGVTYIVNDEEKEED